MNTEQSKKDWYWVRDEGGEWVVDYWEGEYWMFASISVSKTWDEIGPRIPGPDERCEWTEYCDDGWRFYQSNCGKQMDADEIDDDIECGVFKYCPKCGKQIKEVKDESQET